jgi:hypothetical protein
MDISIHEHRDLKYCIFVLELLGVNRHELQNWVRRLPFAQKYMPAYFNSSSEFFVTIHVDKILSSNIFHLSQTVFLDSF